MSYTGMYNGKNVSNQPVCGPYSVSVITGIDFPKVMDHFRKVYNKNGRWKGRSSIPQCLDAIRDLIGVEPTKTAVGGSLIKWVRRVDPNKQYFVRLGGHFITYRDGKIHDQSEIAPVARHWARNKRVTDAFLVPRPFLKKITKSISAIAVHRSSGQRFNMALDIETDGIDVKDDICKSVSRWQFENREYRIVMDTQSNEYRRLMNEL